MRRMVLVMVGLGAAAVPAVALGAMTANTLESEATLSGNGHRAVVTALLTCDQAQRARLRITVTQPGRRVVAQGRRKLRCTTEAGRFPVRVVARGGRLEASEATVCALAVTRDDTRQWCKDVSLRHEATLRG